MEYKDYYQILGVDKKASKDEIKKAYRKLVKKYHPDTGDESTRSKEKFQEVSEAYEVLKDDEKRKKYDAFGAGGNFGNGAHFDPSQYGYKVEYGGGGTDFSDFFNMIFGSSGGFGFNGAGAGGRAYGYSAGADPFGGYTAQQPEAQGEAEISVLEAYNGTERMMQAGSRQIKVKIPAGIKDGEKIRIKSEHVCVKIKVTDDPTYKLVDEVLHMDVKIQPYEAVLGGKVAFNTIDGSAISLNVKAGTQAGQKFKIPRKGYKDRKGNVGDLIVSVVIDVPKSPSEEEIKLYKELQKLHSV
ncbi:MAG: J domain-containing protein [Clostridia bacterium]|nr:J domain-containing protein [Clostridia bacterium]